MRRDWGEVVCMAQIEKGTAENPPNPVGIDDRAGVNEVVYVFTDGAMGRSTSNQISWGYELAAADHLQLRSRVESGCQAAGMS